MLAASLCWWLPLEYRSRLTIPKPRGKKLLVSVILAWYLKAMEASPIHAQSHTREGSGGFSIPCSSYFYPWPFASIT